MLDRSRKPSDIAAHLLGGLGERAFSFVGARVEEARQASDDAGVRLWNDVACELLALSQRAGADGREGGSLWALMQRIEYYRHRATEVERKAAAAPEAYRDDMLELAVQWRDLALHADLQARSRDEGASPEGVARRAARSAARRARRPASAAPLGAEPRQVGPPQSEGPSR